MSTAIGERRQSQRASAAYPVIVCDRRGRMLSRGRTANINESGVYVVVDSRANLSETLDILLHITLPEASARGLRGQATRTVLYSCRVIHSQSYGRLTGLGLKFVRKLA